MDKINIQIANLRNAVTYVMYEISRFDKISKSQGKMDAYGFNRVVCRYFREVLKENYKRDSLPKFQFALAVNDNDVFKEKDEIKSKLNIFKIGLDKQIKDEQFKEFINKSLNEILNE